MSDPIGEAGSSECVCVCVCMILQVKQAVLSALDCGYRHIDCAAAYGNEQEVGQALRERVGPGKVGQPSVFAINQSSLHNNHRFS